MTAAYCNDLLQPPCGSSTALEVAYTQIVEDLTAALAELAAVAAALEPLPERSSKE